MFVKNLVFFQINEFDQDFLINGSKKYNLEIIEKFLTLKNIKIETDDEIEGINLDPWVQWVSINTGLESKVHEIFSLGKVLKKDHLQIWEILSDLNFSSSIWGSMNSSIKSKKNIDFFLPDPWNFSQTSYPKKLDLFLGLPKYFAQNYGSINLIKLFMESCKFLYSIIRLNILKDVLKEIPFFLKSLFSTKHKTLIFVLFIDLIMLLLIKKSLKKKESNLLIVFLNCIAHYQHNYWDQEELHPLFFKWVNKLFKNMHEISNQYKSVIVSNGLSQKKIYPHYIVKIKNPAQYFEEININYKSIEPNMTAGGTIFFDNEMDKKEAYNILNNLKLNGSNIFYLINFEKENKIYFRLELIFFSPVLKLNENSKNVFENFHVEKFTKKELDILNHLLLKLNFIKSTSVHSNTGTLFYKNIEVGTKEKIKNYDIYNIIFNFFKN